MSKNGKIAAIISALVLVVVVCVVVVKSNFNNENDKNDKTVQAGNTDGSTTVSKGSDASNSTSPDKDETVIEDTAPETCDPAISFYGKTVTDSDKYEDGARVYTDGEYDYYYEEESGLLYMITSRDSSTETVAEENRIKAVSDYINGLYPGKIDESKGEWVTEAYDNIGVTAVVFKADTTAGQVDIVSFMFDNSGIFYGGNIYLKLLDSIENNDSEYISEEEALEYAKPYVEEFAATSVSFQNEDLSTFEPTFEFFGSTEVPIWRITYNNTREYTGEGYYLYCFRCTINAVTGEQVGEVSPSK